MAAQVQCGVHGLGAAALLAERGQRDDDPAQQADRGGHRVGGARVVGGAPGGAVDDGEHVVGPHLEALHREGDGARAAHHRQAQRSAGPQAGSVPGGHEGQDDAVVGRGTGDHHDVDQSPAGAPVGGPAQPPARAVGFGAHGGRSGAAEVGHGDAGAGPPGREPGAVPLHGRTRRPAVAQAERAPGDGLGHLVLGDDEPRRAARAAEQFDGLDPDPHVTAEAALLGRHGDGELPGLGEQREVGGVDAAGRVVGGGGVRGEDVAGDPAHGADGGVGGDRRIRREQGRDSGGGPAVVGGHAGDRNFPRRRTPSRAVAPRPKGAAVTVPV